MNNVSQLTVLQKLNLVFASLRTRAGPHCPGERWTRISTQFNPGISTCAFNRSTTSRVFRQRSIDDCLWILDRNYQVVSTISLDNSKRPLLFAWPEILQNAFWNTLLQVPHKASQ